MLAQMPFCGRFLRGSLWVTLITLVAALAIHPAGAQAAAPGTVTDLTWGASPTEVDRTIALMQSSGVKWTRLNVAWNAGEQNGKGAYNAGYFADVDSAVAKVRAAGINVLMPVADGVPYWASADPAKSETGGDKRWRARYRPRSFADYADFFGYVVNRYKSQGVHTFEVWNEPNLQSFWESGVNPAEYTEMLKAAYPAIKAADPSSRVLLAGLSPRNSYDFMQGVYAAGGSAYFDSAAYHVYPNGDPTKCANGSDGRPAFDSFCSLDEFRRIMVAKGDAAKDVWVTEYGFSTCANSASACYGVGVSETQQADYLIKMAQKLDSPAYSYVKAAFLYQFRDWTADGSITPGDWEENLGVLRRDFTPKPSFAAYTTYNTTGTAPPGLGSPNAPGDSGTGANSAGKAPRVKLTSPTAGGTFTRSLTPSAAATDDKAVSKVVFLVDGRAVGSDTSAPYRMSWKAAKKAAYGKHTVSVKAYDADGLSASSSATVTRTRNTTTLSIASRAKAAARNSSTSRGALVAAGSVKGAASGSVRITLRRYDPKTGRWIKGKTARSRLDGSGRYRAALALSPGRWQAQATYVGTPVSQSKVVSFRR